jgi:CTP:phosphocholine cytidylyltransferase-like protein
MNERIKELAIQAEYEKDMFGVGHWDMPECKKFVELILMDVMTICEDLGDKGQDGHYCVDAISKTFRS